MRGMKLETLIFQASGREQTIARNGVEMLEA